MRRVTWLDFLAKAGRGDTPYPEPVLNALSKLDEVLAQIWNLGDNVLLAWTNQGSDLQFLAVPHYAIAETIHGGAEGGRATHTDSAAFVNDILSGPKHVPYAVFRQLCDAFAVQSKDIGIDFDPNTDRYIALISEVMRRYSVSLVRGRAVVLLDAVQFSLHSPLDQMAMLNSLAFSVNSAYKQLLSKEIQVDFARTTTGDGFYIWNRDTRAGANVELYKLMMLILADNAVAQRKASGAWVPRLRAAFHVGEHYEFQQVEGLNPTTFSYIVGQVTIDLARMIEKALPGQILLGDFRPSDTCTQEDAVRYPTPDFVEQTASTLERLSGLDISGGRIKHIRCYLTGQSLGDGQFMVDRHHILDKHGTERVVYNAKINIHRESGVPIFLGIQRDDLHGFASLQVDAVESTR